MNIIGLTGGIGSGKSVVAACFAELGFPVIDTDRIGHELLEQDAGIQTRIRELFGDAAWVDERISREALAAEVFARPLARRQLNDLMHPAILGEAARRCREHAAAGHQACIVEAALFGESGRRDPWLDRLILVLADARLRVERLMTGRGFSEAEAHARIAAQTAPETKIDLADWIIENNRDRDALMLKASQIAEAIHGLSG